MTPATEARALLRFELVLLERRVGRAMSGLGMTLLLSFPQVSTGFAALWVCEALPSEELLVCGPEYEVSSTILTVEGFVLKIRHLLSVFVWL